VENSDEKDRYDASGFAKRLRAAREAARITQTELSGALGVSQQTVASWEIGRTEPNIKMLSRILKFFGTSAEAIMFSSAGPIEIKAEARPLFSPQPQKLTRRDELICEINDCLADLDEKEIEKILAVMRVIF
jgi:transcriptional regulator with XRE-family HTH domain